VKNFAKGIIDNLETNQEGKKSLEEAELMQKSYHVKKRREKENIRKQIKPEKKSKGAKSRHEKSHVTKEGAFARKGFAKRGKKHRGQQKAPSKKKHGARLVKSMEPAKALNHKKSWQTGRVIGGREEAGKKKRRYSANGKKGTNNNSQKNTANKSRSRHSGRGRTFERSARRKKGRGEKNDRGDEEKGQQRLSKECG